MGHGVVDNLIELLVILVAAKVGAELTVRTRQPAVVGELLVGVLVGASVLGWVRPEGMVVTLAEIGVILLLFQVGLETQLGDFVRLGRTALLVALIGVATPFALGYFGALALGLGGGSPEVAIFLGAAMTATSVGITARVLADLRRLNTDEARTIIGAAVIDDVLGLLILAVVVGLLEGDGHLDPLLLGWITLKAVVFLAVVLLVGRTVAAPFFRVLEGLRVQGSFVVGAFVFVIVMALAAELVAGLAPIVGAFAAGLVVAQTPRAGRVGAELQPIAFLFIPIFFLSVGAQVEVGALANPAMLAAGLAIAGLAAAGKLVSGIAASGMNRWVVGVGMVPRGEVGLIFAAIGLSQGLLGAAEHAVVVMMVVLTTLAGPLVLNALLRRAHGDDPAALR